MANISKKLVFGVGVKGDGVAKVNGKNTKAYKTWQHMLERCYDPKKLSKQPTYIGCSVCSEWLFFPTFQKWFDNHYVEGWQLDKDLLIVGNKIYGPDFCVFVPSSINNLFTDHGRARGEYPIGVNFEKQCGKFMAKVRIDGARKYLGLFDSADEAHQAYLKEKKENVIRMANIWRNKIPTKLYDALIQKANDLI